MSYNAFTAKGIEYIASHDWPNLTSLHMSTLNSIKVEIYFMTKE